MAYKICPVCKTKNDANALICKNCSYDISTVPIIEDDFNILTIIGRDFSYAITKDTVLGREATGKEHFIDKAISRKHAKVFYKDGIWYIEDLNSTNGTYINSKRILPLKEYELKDGDKINLANKIEFVVKIRNDSNNTIREDVVIYETFKDDKIVDKTVNKTVVLPVSKLPFSLDKDKIINGYKIINHLATGGESDTYLVEKDEKKYVLKAYRNYIKPNLETIKHIKEISNQYPQNLIRLLAFWEDGKNFYEIYEYCPLGSLSEIIKNEIYKEKFKNPDIILEFVAQVTNGLEVLHKNGIYHRDLKPSNILLRNWMNVVLADFGISKNTEASTVFTKNFKGTYKYAAPETLSNQYNKKSDYWSLGVIVYELYFDKNLFENLGLNAIFSELLNEKEIFECTKTCDYRILTLLTGLLQKDPSKRWGGEEIEEFLKSVNKPLDAQNLVEDSEIKKVEEKKNWEDYGFDIKEAEKWEEAGFTPQEAEKWKEAGFILLDAVVLKNAFITPEEAKYAKKEGVSINEMVKLKTTSFFEIQALKVHNGSVNCIKYSQNGKMFASGGNDYVVKIWDETASNQLAIFDRHTDYVTSVVFTPDNKTVISASRDKSIKFWDIKSKKLLLSLEGHRSYVSSLAITKDGKFLASGSWDTMVRIWDLKEKKAIDVFEDNASHIFCLDFSYDGRFLASGSEDGTLIVWNFKEKNIHIKKEDEISSINTVVFHPSKNILAYGMDNGEIVVLDIEKRIELYRSSYKIGVRSIIFLFDGNIIACGREDGTIALIDITIKESFLLLDTSVEDIYKDTKDYNSHIEVKKGKFIEIWNKEENKKISTIKMDTLIINSIDISKNYRYMVCGKHDGSIVIWESYLPKTIENIYKSGFNIKEYLNWSDLGFNLNEAAIWKKEGFNPENAKEWKNFGFLPKEAKEWIIYNFSLQEAVNWKKLEFLPNIAYKWKQEGMDLHEIFRWMDAGFDIEEAKKWKNAGFDLEEAKEWSQYNISPIKAKKLKKFGFLGRILAKFF